MTNKIGVDIVANASGLDEGYKFAEKRTQEFSGSVQKSATDISSSSQKMADSLSMSAKQTAAALRMVPAQLTDIVTQLAGGQNPLLILTQQGGQLMDMFGGIGPAAQAMGTYIAGLINPLSLAAVTASALTYAFISGNRESENFTKSLIMSGNAAGTSVGQLQAMAYQVAANAEATHGAAAATLNELAATGKVSSEILETASAAALRLERVGGPAVETTVKAFAALGEDPVSAVLKLNDQYHFLTGAVYEQIKALSDQGREADAAALAQRSYADAINDMIPALASNVGVLEKAWMGLKDVAKGAWDAMAGIGREASVESQISVLEKELAARNQKKPSGEYHLWDIDQSAQQSGEGTQKIEEQLRVLRSMQSSRAQLALSAQREAEINAADLFISQRKENSLSKQEKMEREIQAIRNNAATAGTPQDEVDDLIKKTQEKYTEKKKQSVDEYGQLMNRLAGLDANYAKDLDTLYSAYQKGKLGIDDYRQAVEQLIQKQPFAVKKAQEEKRAQDEQAKSLEFVQRAEERAGKATSEFTIKTNDRVEAIQRQIELLGKTPDQAAVINAFADIERQADALLVKYEEVRKMLWAAGKDTSEIDALISGLPELADLAKGDAADALDRLREAQDKLNASWDYGANEALRKYLDEVGNVAAQSERLVTNSFKGMEDALTEFAKTGKLDFSSLADSIISDMVRMQIKASVTGPLAGMLQNAGGIGGFFSGLFGSSYGGLDTGAGSGFDSALWGVASAKGNVFSGSPDLHQYVNTVQTSPKVFGFDRMHAFAKGGIFAEEDPEAVMPLARDGQGRLGVRSSDSSSAPTSITVEINNNGTAQKVTSAQPSFDARGMVISIITEDIDRNGPVTSSLASKFNLAQRAF